MSDAARDLSRDVERFNRWAPNYERHRLQQLIFEPVQQTVLELAAGQVPRPRAILDVGCGTGRLLRTAHLRFPDARLEGVDPAVEMVRQAQAERPAEARIAFRQGAAEHLPFGDGEFDLVFSTMTFHHWSDQAQGAAEIGRVLAAGGRWVLADFVATGAMRYIRRLLRMSRFPERGSLDRMVETAGMEVVAERHPHGLAASHIHVLAIGRP